MADRRMEQEQATENTPLLPHGEQSENSDQSQPHRERSAEDLLNSIQSGNGNGNSKKSKRRWPSLFALLLLCLAAILIMVFAFFAPSVVEQYAAEATVFEPTSLSIDSFTSSGVKARIEGNFWMDASRVEQKAVRDLGRFATWIASDAESGEAEVEVSLPEYGNVVLGTAQVPGVKVNIRNGHTTHIDVVSDLEPGSKEGIRRIANDWIEGRLGQVRVLGKARIPLKSGIFSFGKQTIRHELVFDDKDVPAIPGYDIQRLNIHDAKEAGMEADVSLVVANKYPIDFAVPPLGFQILVPGCRKSDPYILVADAMTEDLHIRPKQDVELNVTGLIRKLPDSLRQDCPNTKVSPLDIFLGNYIRGDNNTIYVRGARSPADETPKWVSDLMKDIIVPVELPGQPIGHLIENFTLADTHFDLPNPFADPNRDESKPRISATVQALIALPKEMNFDVSAQKVRAEADVYYKGDKFGTLNLDKWQPANSTRIDHITDEKNGLLVESRVEKVPLDISDEEVFSQVLQDLLFGSKSVIMQVKADIDVQVETALGELRVHKIPAEGEVPVKPISEGKSGPSFMPKISDLQIIDTTKSSLTITALVNITNPTQYSASIPYVDIHVVKNGSVLAHATARDLAIVPGENDNLLVTAVYDPLNLGGHKAQAIGRELLSQYLSGFNTTISLQTHKGTIPSQPKLGEALSKFIIEVPAPKIGVPRPSDPNDPNSPPSNETHFIEDATMHLFTSTATFTLLSPLKHTVIYIDKINATALYKGEDVGRIEYDLPFAVPPVDRDGKGVTSPRLPVDWSLGSVGYDAVKNALGGTLKLGTLADVSVRIQNFRETVWFRGRGIGAHIRL